MSQQYLIDVYKDTKSQFKNYKSPLCAQYSILKHNIQVVNEDCINVVRDLSNIKTCLLNMASYKHAGGGVENGRTAQEEIIARRSNLVDTLQNIKYPFGYYDYAYSINVTFFKDEKYNKCEPFQADVISVAAINLNKFEQGDYESIMTHKIMTILIAPYLHGCQNLVLSALGCGVYKNDPNVVATLFKNCINSLPFQYNNIVFAIYNDKNAANDNFGIFKSVLC